MIIRLNKLAHLDTVNNHSSSAIGVEGDPIGGPGKLSEAEKIVAEARRKVREDGVPGVGVSGSNSGKGHEPVPHQEETFKTTSMEKVVEEEPTLTEGDPLEMTPEGGAPAVSTHSGSLPKSISEQSGSGTEATK
jgi:protein phosphatase PTC1